jgi:hypothetical protein
MTREEAVRRIHRAAEEKLTQLDLSGLDLEELPPEIGKCPPLEMLVLGKFEKRKLVGNKLTEFPDAVLQLTNLKILNLSWNQITAIPEAIGQLLNLTQLNLHSNQITSIPEELGQLSNLTQLDLRSNQITSIPENLGQLSNLTQLYLGNNQITSIPEDLGQLSNLTELSLIYNQITAIPEAIRGMEKLEKLDLRANPIPIPPEILQGEEFYEPGDLRTILDFYFQTRNSNDTEEVNEAKLLIVGEGESGKTTLANKLLNPDYQLKKQEPSTEGINLIVRYKYEFMPKGIITRLIVEMHRLICRPNIDPCSGAARRDIVWRDGVLLAEKYAKAEVIENYHQGEIRIRVSGTQKNYLLNSIRYQLWKIHDTYDKRLKYQEFIPCNCSQCKGSQNPSSYPFDELRDRLAHGKYTVGCRKPPSYEEVQVRGLIEDFPDYSQEKVPGIDPSPAVDYSREYSSYPPSVSVTITQMNSDSSNKPITHFSGPMSGVIGSENAQVSGNQFNQTNNANTD